MNQPMPEPPVPQPTPPIPKPKQPTVWEAFKEAVAMTILWFIGGKTTFIGKMQSAPVPVLSERNSYSRLANEICLSMRSNKDIDVKALDPITIWMIIQIIYQIVKCYINKKMSKKEALDMVNEPGLLQKALLRSMINRTVKAHNRRIGSDVSHEAFKRELYSELLKIGKTGTITGLKRLEEDMPEISKYLEENK